MEHVIEAATAGSVRAVVVTANERWSAGDVLLLIDHDGNRRPGRGGSPTRPPRRPSWPPRRRRTGSSPDPDQRPRPELVELLARVAGTLDAGRPVAQTERRHAGGRRHGRENIADLCVPAASGPRPFSSSPPSGRAAAQRISWPTRRPMAWWPALGTSTATLRCRAVPLRRALQHSVLAGTQGQQPPAKKDRLFDLVERLRLPVVLFAEGGGSSPGDTDMAVVTGLDTEAFLTSAR